MKTYEVIIIGAGTAGLSARKEVAKKTDNYIVVDDGPLGTTCARVGCMPSKVLIQAANDYYRRKSFSQEGILGAEGLRIDLPETMSHVRKLRDRFTGGVIGSLSSWEDKLVRKRAKIVDKNTLLIGEESVSFKKLIIATGSSPVIPGPWREFSEALIDTDEFFEMDTLPSSMAIIGLGVIGLELGQALHRLGVKVVAFSKGKAIGGLSDPEIQDYVADKLGQEMEIHLNGVDIVGFDENKQLQLKADGKTFCFDKRSWLWAGVQTFLVWA